MNSMELFNSNPMEVLVKNREKEVYGWKVKIEKEWKLSQDLTK